MNYALEVISKDGKKIVFNKEFLDVYKNVLDLSEEDIKSLMENAKNDYSDENIDYEKVLYYLTQMQFSFYSPSNSGEDEDKEEKEDNRWKRVDSYFQFKDTEAFGGKDKQKDRLEELKDNSKMIVKFDGVEFSAQKLREKLQGVSDVIQECGEQSLKWFNARVDEALDLLKKGTGIDEIVNKDEDRYNYHQRNFASSGSLSGYFWDKIKFWYKDNPIALSVFFNINQSNDIRVAIELLDDNAKKTRNYSYYVEKINNVIEVLNDPEKYGVTIKDKDKNEILYMINDGNLEDEKKDEVPLGELDKAKLNNEKKRVRVFYKVDKCDSNEDISKSIKEGMRILWDLCKIISYDTFIGSEINKTLYKRNMKQLIFNGAPGTGKTYGVKKYIKGIATDDRWHIIQFHPSYDYTDFVEGIRPVSSNNNTSTRRGKNNDSDMSFVKVDGEFKRFCRRVVKSRLDKIFELQHYTNPTDKAYEELFGKIVSLSEMEEKGDEIKADEAELLDIFDAVKPEYEEFYYFIIDEINRADISKVFGELMYGLEYRGVQNRVPTQYSQLKVVYETKNNTDYVPMRFDCFRDGFFVPKNVVIIGTMNDIDKSVESFDFAMRRRFQWISVDADVVMGDVLRGMLCNNPEEEKKYQARIDALAARINNMNKILVDKGKDYGLTSEYKIGPSYFKDYCIKKLDEGGEYEYKAGLINKESLVDQFDLRVAPTIREYIRGRADEKTIKDFVEMCREALKDDKAKK